MTYELFEVIQRCDQSIPMICVVICSHLKIKYSKELETKVKNEVRSYKKQREKLHKKQDLSTEYLERVVIKAEDFEYDLTDLDSPVMTKKMRKPFHELGKKMKRERSQKLVDAIYSFIEEEDSSLTVNELLGYLLYRHNYVKKKELSNLGLELFNNSI